MTSLGLTATIAGVLLLTADGSVVAMVLYLPRRFR